MSASEAKAAIFGYRCDVVEGPTTDVSNEFNWPDGVDVLISSGSEMAGQVMDCSDDDCSSVALVNPLDVVSS